MYAVIQTGSKQYRVQPGDIVQIEKLEGEVGAPLNFEHVLLVAKANGDKDPQIWLGKPEVSGAKVAAEIVGQGRGEKILIIKMKRRKQYRRTQGHRQWYTQVLVTGVENGSGDSAKLSDEDKKTRLASFQTHLKQPGPAFSVPKWLLASEESDESETENAGLLSTGAPSGAKKKAPAQKKTGAKKTPAKTKAAKK